MEETEWFPAVSFLRVGAKVSVNFGSDKFRFGIREDYINKYNQFNKPPLAKGPLPTLHS